MSVNSSEMTLCISTRDFPTMKSYIGMAMLRSILLCLLAYQNLVTVKTTFIFFVPLSDSTLLPSTRRTFLSDSTLLPSTTDDYEELPSDYEELLADRKKFIPVELLSKDVLSHDVPEKEANIMYWRDFARSVDNMDVINSVKNRSNQQHHNTPSFSTTEYFAGLQDNGSSTLLFYPLQLCIPVDFNNNNAGNNIDFNLIAFCLQSSLVHQLQPTVTVLFPAMIMIHEIDFAVLADEIISGERYDTSLASIHGERLLLHQVSSFSFEQTRPPATITGTTAPINTTDHYVDPYGAHDTSAYSFDLDNSDIFLWGMHYCLLHDADYSNNDGGGVCKMPIMSLQSDGFSVPRRVIGPQLSYLSDIVRVMHMHTHPFVYVTPYKPKETCSYCNNGVVNENGEAYCFKSPSNSSYISVLHHEHVHHHHQPCLIHRDNEVANGNGRSKLPSDSPYWNQDALMIDALMIRLVPAYHVCSHAIHMYHSIYLVRSQDYGEPVDCSSESEGGACSIGSKGGACSTGSKEEGMLYGSFKSRNGSTNLLVPLQVTALLLEINYSQSTVLDAWQQPLLLGNIRSNYDSNLGVASYSNDCGMRIDDGEDIHYAFYHIMQSIRRVRKGYLADHGTNGVIQHGNLRPISEISGVYVDRFIACNILCCRQAFELGAIFFDIEAWGECLCCLFYEARQSHYMSANGLLMDSQFAGNLEEEMRYNRETMDFLISDRAQADISARVRGYLQALQMELLWTIHDWIIDRELHAITYAHLVGTTRGATMLRDDIVEDIRLKRNVLERISADKSSLYDACAWFDTTTTAASLGIDAIPVKRSGLLSLAYNDRSQRLDLNDINVKHVLIRYRTGMPDIANCTTIDWEAEVKSSVKVREHNTAWNAQALSSVTAASAVMICASSPCAIILSRRLPLLSIQLHSFDGYLSGNTDDLLDKNGTSYQFPTSCYYGIRTTPRFCEHGSPDSTEISSCTLSTEYGEHLQWVMDKLFGVNSTRCVVDSTENHSLLGIDGVFMQQLMEHLMQQLMEQRWMDLAYHYSSRKQHRSSAIMTSFDANLNASVRSYNVPSTSNVVTTNGELRFFAMGGDMPLDRHH